jgi:hypothetical protein
MTLSEHEQRTLKGIEAGCRIEDPGFAERLDLTALQHRRSQVIVIAQCTIWIGWVTMVIGGGLARGLLSIGTLVACYGLALIIAGTVTWFRNRRPRIRALMGSSDFPGS